MKIFIIGTTAYKEMMEEHANDLRPDHQVRMPAFDEYNLDELRICLHNIQDIRWADEVHIFWDQRSMGTVFDFGAAMALRKKIRIIYMNPKTFANVMRWYANPVLYQQEVFGNDKGPGPSAPF